MCLGFAAALAQEPLQQPRADVYSLSGAYTDDDAYAVQLGADWAAGGSTHIHLDAANGVSPSTVGDITVYRGRFGVDYASKSVGIDLSYEYWGDPGVLDTHAGLGELYWHSAATRVAAQFQQRRITLHYEVPDAARGFIDDAQRLGSTAFGLTARHSFSRVKLRANAIDYRYSEPIGEVNVTRVPAANRETLLAIVDRTVARTRVLSASSLTLANGLLDNAVGAGIETEVGQSALDIEATRERAQVDGLVIGTLSIGWIAPMGDRGDIEYRIGASRAQELGTIVFATISLWFYR